MGEEGEKQSKIKGQSRDRKKMGEEGERINIKKGQSTEGKKMREEGEGRRRENEKKERSE